MLSTGRLSLEGKFSGPENMARDVALLQGARIDGWAARVYAWQGAWVSLGAFQTEQTALKAGSEVCWVRRPTGGRAVLHGHDVTLGFAASFGCLQVGSRELRRAYRAMVEPLVRALQACGIPAELGERTEFLDRSRGLGADCFAHVAALDVVHPKLGYKTCGCALRLYEDCALIQCSIPVAEPLVDARTLFFDAVPPHFHPLDVAVFAEALTREFESTFH